MAWRLCLRVERRTDLDLQLAFLPLFPPTGVPSPLHPLPRRRRTRAERRERPRSTWSTRRLARRGWIASISPRPRADGNRRCSSVCHCRLAHTARHDTARDARHPLRRGLDHGDALVEAHRPGPCEIASMPSASTLGSTRVLVRCYFRHLLPFTCHIHVHPPVHCPAGCPAAIPSNIASPAHAASS